MDMKVFFINYDKADRDWAEWIACQLEDAKYSVVLQAWEFRPCGNSVLDMQKAITELERTIAILSPDYLASHFTAPESATAFAQNATGKRFDNEIKPKACASALAYMGLTAKRKAGQCA